MVHKKFCFAVLVIHIFMWYNDNVRYTRGQIGVNSLPADPRRKNQMIFSENGYIMNYTDRWREGISMLKELLMIGAVVLGAAVEIGRIINGDW